MSKNIFIISGLKERAGIIKGKIEALGEQRVDLEHGLAALRTFDPNHKGKRIYPRRPAS